MSQPNILSPYSTMFNTGVGCEARTIVQSLQSLILPQDTIAKPFSESWVDTELFTNEASVLPFRHYPALAIAWVAPVYNSWKNEKNLELVIKQLSLNGVAIKDYNKVGEFISLHSELIDYIIDVPTVVERYFPNSHLNIETFSDPDQQDDFQQLFFEIKTDLSPKEANCRLSELNRSWLLPIENQDAYLINFSLIFT